MSEYPERTDNTGHASDFEQSFLRAQNEDDDGYDPYSDRPADRSPLFEEDPWR